MILRALQRLSLAASIPALRVLPVRPRLLHSSRVLLIKRHQDVENNVSHQFLARDPKYQATLAPIAEDFYHPKSPMQSDEFTEILANDVWSGDSVLDNFVKISYFINKQGLDVSLSEPCFNTMIAQLIEASPSFNFDDLCKTIFCINLWPSAASSRSPNFMELWNQLDTVCQTTYSDWTVSQILVMLDHWYNMGLLRICQFGRVANRKLLRNMNSLTSAQVVQVLFYCNARRIFPDMDVARLQVHLEKRISALSMEEVGICAMAFFKTKKRILSFNLMEMMIRKCISNADSANSISVSCLAKVIRLGLHIGLIPLMYQMLDAMYPRVKNGELSTLADLHLILAGTNVQMLHHGIMTSVTEHLLSNIKEIRLKDLERFALALQMFKWPKEVPGVTDDLYRTIMDELRRPERVEECNMYPRSFTSLLHYLSVIGLYDYELADKALGHEFLNVIYMPSIKASGFEILSLDVGLEVDCPDYKGARLPAKARGHLSKEISRSPFHFRDFQNSMCKGSYSDKKFKEIAAAFSKIIGPGWENKLYIGHILPNYYRPDIVLKLSDDFENFEEISSEYDYQYPGVIKRPDNSNWVAVVYACRSLVVRGNENEVIGSLAMKLRWLEKIGYNCLLVPNLEWPENADDQIDKLENLLAECKKSMKINQLQKGKKFTC